MNYRLGVFADIDNVKITNLKASLVSFFPYHVITGNNKIEKLVKSIAADYACLVTNVSGATAKEVFMDILKNSPDVMFIIWDGEGEDGREFLKLCYKHKIDTYIYYE